MPDPVTTSKQQERCPTCGSDDPEFNALQYVEGVRCRDLFHTPAQPVEQRRLRVRQGPGLSYLISGEHIDGEMAVVQKVDFDWNVKRAETAEDALTTANQQIERAEMLQRTAEAESAARWNEIQIAQAKIEELTRQRDQAIEHLREAVERLDSPHSKERFVTDLAADHMRQTQRADAAEAQRDTLRETLREAVDEYVDHQSWRCGHPDRYPLDEVDPPDCPCGLHRFLIRARSLLSTPPDKGGG